MVEALVLVAAAAVLLALLLPLISSSRAIALRIVCTSRIRDLTLACNLHRADHHAYPLQPDATRGSPLLENLPGPITVFVLPPTRPTDMDAAFLNALRPYLRFPAIDEDGAVSSGLPHVVQCPTVEDADDALRHDARPLPGAPRAFYTGYAYCVRPEVEVSAGPVRLLRPERAASPRNAQRAVVWADDLQWSAAGKCWRFAHGTVKTRQNVAALLGQHRAYSDGSVEWLSAMEIDLETNLNNAPQQSASLSVSNLYFYWF